MEKSQSLLEAWLYANPRLGTESDNIARHHVKRCGTFPPHALHQRKGIARLLLHIARSTLHIEHCTLLTVYFAQYYAPARGISSVR